MARRGRPAATTRTEEPDGIVQPIEDPCAGIHIDLDPATSGTQQFAQNASSNNGTKSTPCLIADLFGDWREEVIWRRSDNTASRSGKNARTKIVRCAPCSEDVPRADHGQERP